MNCGFHQFIFFVISLIFSFSAVAQQCENLIALSKTVTSTVADKSSFTQHAENFCNEYKKGSVTDSSTNIGASYKFLSASFGQSNMSRDEVASKVCSAKSGETALADAFKQYVETIAIGAYAAYETCVRLGTTSDLRFDVDIGSMLPAEFTVIVGYPQAVGYRTADLIYSASSGISCTWNGLSTEKTTLKAPSSVSFKCDRANQSKPGYVRLARTNGVGGALTLPWPAYDANGIPVVTIAGINSNVQTLLVKLENLQSSHTALSAKLSEEQKSRKVTFVKMGKACPAGWTDAGLVGLLINKVSAPNHTLGGGGPYGSGWIWQHPIMCTRDINSD